MSTPTALWKKWEGRVVDGKFLLRQWLGESGHSAVFLTERAGKESQKAIIKLIPAGDNINEDNLNEDAQLSWWADAAKLSHPHLIRLFECGRCEIDGTRVLYVVMEYAEENLAEILPLRPLAGDEASAMLRPATEALAYLHQSGFVHGRIKPSNILAASDQLKISTDSLRKAGDRGESGVSSAYDAPEIATSGPSPAADIWSLGATLVAVMTQNEPKLKSAEVGIVALPETIPLPLREIARQCLQTDPQQRCTPGQILSQLQPQPRQTPAPRDGGVIATDAPPAHSKRRIVLSIVVVAFLLVALLVFRSTVHQSPVPAAETHATTPAETTPAQSPAPFSDNKKPAQKGVVRGSVLQQVMPDVSRSAQNTITGRFKVSVQVEVDAAGNVSQARLVSPGPSPYFANHALAAARSWKFNPPQVDGKAAVSEWLLRFQFSRSNIQVSPAEVKP
jgi:TonB family protein